jgi:hypothetical protein
MTDVAKWKAGLMASGMPLKFQAANILVSKGFSVRTDYRFGREASSDQTPFQRRETRVDLYGVAHSPFSKPEKVTAQVELLAECVHRRPEAAWLFLPDPNTGGGSPAAPGRTVRAVDQFSHYTLGESALASLDADLTVCQAGLEVDRETGETDYAAIGQGLTRLQHALPRLFSENVMGYMTAPPQENVPFLFCPILLTTAPLFVMEPGMDMARFAGADRIEDIAAQRPYLMMYLDYGPEFEILCREECARMTALQRSDKAMLIEQKRARHSDSQHYLPFTLIDALVTGERFYLAAFFTQFIVCTLPSFPALLDLLKKTASSVLRSRKYIQ